MAPSDENLPTEDALLPDAHAELRITDWPGKQETQALTTSSQTFQLAGPTPSNIVIMDDGIQPLVTIHPDGTLEYGPGYDPDEAASRFWDALRRCMPGRCPSCGHILGQEQR
ncbi:hypothetical protein ACH4TX_42260 [Streptomyces sp. NPDC021098]|uniref:hypothetical protein n=1 Tax=unclassified Streptomyces TaxID=2593676 RepID=UPI0037BDE673